MSTKTAHGSLFPESQKLAKGGKSQITRHGAGVFTTEGNVAGARAGRLAANREKERQQYMKERDALKAKHAKKSVTDINKNFSRTTNENERKFKEATVGMVTLEEFRRAKAETGLGGKGGAGSPGADTEADSERRKKKLEAKRLKKKRKQKKMMARLSFAGAGEDEEDEDQAEGAGDGSPASAAAEAGGDAKKQRFSKFGKDPTVATDFLPDRDRELQEQQQREKLKTQWLKQQEKVKAESLQVTYSYWDGSGHRRDIIVTKGMTMRQFLEAVRRDLLQEFPELRSVSVENLMYVKEDLIIPHNYTFYDLIISKARGKSGPLFHFDVHDDVRIGLNDSRIEKDESHPGKIVERRWFEINKHIFPASRWEVYDPKKDWGGYTIHGGEVRGKNADEDGDDSAALAGWWSIGAGL